MRIHDCTGTTGAPIAAYWGALDTIKGGVTAEQMMAARDHCGGTALRVAALRGHIDQIGNGVTVQQLLADPTTDVSLLSSSDEWRDHNATAGMSTMQLVERAIEVSGPGFGESLVRAVRGDLPVGLRRELLRKVETAKERFREAASPDWKRRRTREWQRLVDLCVERNVPVSPLSAEATAELL